MSLEKNAKKKKKNHTIRIANKSLENVAKPKYFGVTLTNQIHTHEEINRRPILNSENACYHLV
jgi:hypothetical protein